MDCSSDVCSSYLVPDPRYYALQKLWLAEQTKRNPLKRPKDAKQGLALLQAVAEAMPQYPLDESFEHALPEDITEIFRKARGHFIATALASRPDAEPGF